MIEILRSFLGTFYSAIDDSAKRSERKAIDLHALYQRETRHAAQFDGTRMIDRLLDRDFNRAVRFVINDLPNRLRDPEYAAELERSRGWDVDPERHPELLVLGRLEETGIYLRHRLLLGARCLTSMRSWYCKVGST